MKYENAASGIKMVFAGELIQLIGSLCLSIFAGFVGQSVLVLVIGVLVSALLPTILMITGLVKAGKDEQSFKSAWQEVIALFIIQIIFVILGAFGIGSDSPSTWVIAIIDTMITIYILQGVGKIYEAKGISATFVKVTMVIFTIGAVIQIIASIFSTSFLGGVEAGNMLVIIATVIMALAQFISYIFYLVVLGGAGKKFLQ